MYIICNWLQIKQFQLIGYQVLAVGYFEDDVQVAYTTDLEGLMDQSYVESIRAAMINGIRYKIFL